MKTLFDPSLYQFDTPQPVKTTAVRHRRQWFLPAAGFFDIQESVADRLPGNL
jgi:hypothetical protein